MDDTIWTAAQAKILKDLILTIERQGERISEHTSLLRRIESLEVKVIGGGMEAQIAEHEKRIDELIAREAVRRLDKIEAVENAKASPAPCTCSSYPHPGHPVAPGDTTVDALAARVGTLEEPTGRLEWRCAEVKVWADFIAAGPVLADVIKYVLRCGSRCKIGPPGLCSDCRALLTEALRDAGVEP